MAATTTRKITNEGKAFLKRVEELKQKPHVDIGLPESVGSKSANGSDGKLTVAEVGTFHEFGTEHVPQRSFLRANDEENREKYKKFMDELRDKIIFGMMPAKQALGLLGEVIQKDIKARIVSGIAPALKQSTIDRKGSSTPLIDTGQMINSIRYQVYEKGKG